LKKICVLKQSIDTEIFKICII